MWRGPQVEIGDLENIFSSDGLLGVLIAIVTSARALGHAKNINKKSICRDTPHPFPKLKRSSIYVFHLKNHCAECAKSIEPLNAVIWWRKSQEILRGGNETATKKDEEFPLEQNFLPT